MSSPTGFDPTNRFTTSWLIPPYLLFFQRLIYSLYAFATLAAKYIYNGSQGDEGALSNRRSFSYFTELTWWGLAFYSAFAAIHTASYWLRGKSFLNGWPRFFQETHRIFYMTITIYPFLVTVVFWILLFSRFATTYSLWSNVTQHGLNSLYALTEIIVPRTEPHPWIHIIPLVIILACYLAVAYITYYAQGWYTYGFLDNQNNRPALVGGYIVGILVAAIVLFVIVRYTILLRVYLTEKKSDKIGKFSKKDQENPKEYKDDPIEMN